MKNHYKKAPTSTSVGALGWKGFKDAERAPLHKEPEVPFYRIFSHPYSRIRSGSFRVTSQAPAAVLQTALVTCSSERKLNASPHTLYFSKMALIST